MRVTSLGSGSSGNALLVEAGPQGRTKLLVDVGLPPRTLLERLRLAGAMPTQLQGVLVTHEHSDHIIGLPLLNKRYAIPVIAASDTLTAIERSFISGAWYTDSGPLLEPSIEPGTQNGELRQRIPLPVGVSCVIGDIEITSFPVSHDAVSPCGYLLRAGGCRVCVAIDSGEVTSTMLNMMKHADLLVLESNHDRDRLLRGPYPYHLKMRILSPTGHLSNAQAAEAVLQTWRADSVRWLWLSHLSRTNNSPKLALQSMLASLSAAKVNLSQIHIRVLPPGMGSVWDSTQLWHSPSLWEMEG